MITMSDATAAQTVRELEHAARAAHRLGDVEKHTIAVDPERWGALASRQVQALIEGGGAYSAAEKSISRHALWELAKRTRQAEGADRAVLARALLWSSLAWGHGTTYRLAKKRSEQLIAQCDDFALTIFDAAQRPLDADRESLFQSLRRAEGAHRVKFWGPNFFSKFLYFSAPRTTPATHLIVDQRVRATLATIRHPRVGPIHAAQGGYGWVSYDACVLLLNLLANEWGICPDDVEFAAFSMHRTGAGGA